MSDPNGNSTQVQTQHPAQVTINATKPSDFPEMPFSWNVTAVSPDGFNEMFTVRAVNMQPFVQRISAMKDFLFKNDYKPAPTRGAPSVAASQDSEPAPLCAIHHEPMAKRQGKRGESFWSCPKKLDDGSWCPYRPPNK